MTAAAQILFNLAILGRKNKTSLHWPIIIGAFASDIPLLVFYGLEKIKKVPDDIIWNQHFLLPEWQTLFDMFRSFPILVAALLFCWLKKLSKWTAFLGSIMLHTTLDFVFTETKIGSYFWPITDWKFKNPIKYLNIEYYDPHWQLIELGIMIICIFFVFKLRETENKKGKDVKKEKTSTKKKKNKKK